MPNHKLTIFNQTRNVILAEQCVLANTFWSRALGLMGKAGLAEREGLLIYPEWSIHTFFMRFPIDLLFLNQRDQVIGLRVAMPPYRPFAGVWGAHYVIELPPNLIPTTQTQVGDQLLLTPSPHKKL